MQPTLQDNQLMSKHRVLSFKPQLRLEWRGQHGQNETEQPDHSASLGDSTTSSTQIKFSVHTSMAKYKTVAMSYGALRKECLEAVRQWPGCETVGGIQIIRSNTPVGFSGPGDSYGKADKKIADRAIICVQR
jgi:hypothetical protein